MVSITLWQEASQTHRKSLALSGTLAAEASEGDDVPPPGLTPVRGATQRGFAFSSSDTTNQTLWERQNTFRHESRARARSSGKSSVTSAVGGAVSHVPP